jgi:ZIP family zinc transporter
LVNTFGVFGVALGTALATGLGAIPVLIVRGERRNSTAIANAVAAGFMLGATVGLIYEGAVRSIIDTALGAVAGIVFIAVTRRLIGRDRDAHIGNLRGARGLTAFLVVGVMTVHSAAEGVAIGVSSAGEESLGLLIAAALAIHNIPEGVAVSLALMPFGVSARRAAAWSIVSSLPQPLLAVPAFVAVRFFDPVLAAGLGFAAGAMAWMVFTQLLPQSLTKETRHLALVATVASAGLMIVVEVAVVI